MADRPTSTILIRQFSGLNMDADQMIPDLVPPGTGREQVNLSSSDPAMLRTRAGVKVVTFESGG